MIYPPDEPAPEPRPAREPVKVEYEERKRTKMVHDVIDIRSESQYVTVGSSQFNSGALF